MGVTNASQRRNEIWHTTRSSRRSVPEGWARYIVPGMSVSIGTWPSKCCRNALRYTAEALARFQREAKLLAAVSHPNLVAIFDVGTDHGICFAVMEFLAGETLRELLDRGTLPLAPRSGNWGRGCRGAGCSTRTRRHSP